MPIPLSDTLLFTLSIVLVVKLSIAAGGGDIGCVIVLVVKLSIAAGGGGYIGCAIHILGKARVLMSRILVISAFLAVLPGYVFQFGLALNDQLTLVGWCVDVVS